MGTLVHTIVFALCISFNLFVSSAQQACTNDTFSSNKLYSACSSLPVLSGTLHWAYHPNGTVDIAYRIPQVSNGWVGWGINPTSKLMSGSNALIAYHDTTGTVNIISSILTDEPVLQDQTLKFPVYHRSVEYINGYYTIYATIGLPGNLTEQNIVWQAGTIFSGGVPNGHALSSPNILSYTSMDFVSGLVADVPSSTLSAAENRSRQKNIHGVLNAVGWGILLPLGIILARYIKALNSSSPAWFYAHVTCQISGYVLGAAGFGLGIKLGNESVGITYHKHRIIGIFLFCIATIQAFAIFMRPKPTHRRRIYWNFYHYTLAFFIIVLGITNIFKGFVILNPAIKWKHAYSAIIITLGIIAVVLELCKWTVCRKRNSNTYNKPPNGS